MDLKSSWSSSFEFEDIEIIAHKKEDEEKSEKWYCDQCSLFFLEKGKLDEHKKKHSVQEIVNCKYCNKTLSSSEVNSDCYINRKCETCEYKCSKCPQRFLRHSSLMNHEKKHSSPKKKRGVSNNKKINGICPENVASSKGVKRRRIDTDDSEEQPKRLKTRNVEKIQKKKINPQVKTKVLDGNNSSIKTPKRSLLKARKSAEETNNCENVPVKVAERLSLKTTNLPEGKVGNKHKHNTTTINSLTSPTPNMSSNENVVNYKPFSCHVCGDTFASDSALLGHIRTHGENAVKSFKCKYCGDEFDDVYKMQYHLAICPLAEDELETSLKQAIPVKLPIKYGGETCSPRKRGRPKKKVEMTSDQESYENKLSPSSCNKVNVKKRKSEVLENNGTVPKQSKKSQSIEPLTDPNEPLPCDVAEITKEKEVDDDKKKLHHCPFPRCDFKFTREKALLCHMRNHSDDFDDSLKCHKCDIPFDDIQTLRLHINECKGIKEEKDDDFNQPYRADCYDTSPSRTIQRSRKDFVCNGCGRSYQSQEKLDRHLESCASKFVCRICKDDFLNQPLLDEHFGSKHPSYTAYHCYICEEDFISELFLQIHQADEHGKKLAKPTKPEQDSFRVKAPTSPHCDEVVDTLHAFDPVSVKSSKKSTSPVSVKSSRCANTIHTGPVVSSATGRCTNRGNHSFWCPICLEGFDERENMRDHFRENHIVENNSLYSCKICEIKMPFAEMMCYHLELHSSNLLSVNRFSKLISYVKQNKVGELRSSEVEIKCEEISEDVTSSQLNETADIDCQGASKAVAENPTKVVKNKSCQQIESMSEFNEVSGHTSSSQMEFRSRQKPNFAINLRKKSENRSNRIDGNKSQELIKPCRVIRNSNGRNELKNIIRDKINLEKSTRPLRSRVQINYSLVKQAKKECGRQKTKLRKVSGEEIYFETVSLNEICDNFDEIDNSKNIKPVELVNETIEPTHKKQTLKIVDSDKKQGVRNKEILLTRQHCLSTMKQSKILDHEVNVKTNVHVSEKNATDSEISGKSTTSSGIVKRNIRLTFHDNTLNLSTEEKKLSTGQTRRLKKRSKGNKHLRYSNTGIESKPNNEEESKEMLDVGEISVRTVHSSVIINNSGNTTIFNSSDVTKNGNNDGNLNFELEDRSFQMVTGNPEQNNLNVIGGSSGITEDSSKLEAIVNVQSEGLVDMPERRIINDQSIDENSENPQSISKEQDHEESRASLTSTIGESDEICCTMCTERFFNQDELLDHVATHI